MSDSHIIWLDLLGLAIAGYLVHGLYLVIYRLFFSPIAHFPGSKIAAATGWYETYLDVFKGGQFTFQIDRWHQQYGPVIRINPWEIHISDPEFHETLYSQSSRYTKIEKLKNRFGHPESTFDTIHHELHRQRRAVVAPYFSRQRILEYSEYIQSRVDKVCHRLQAEYAGTGKPVTMNYAWATLTSDVVNYYTFTHSYDFVDYPDFDAPFTKAINNLARSLHTMGHFPWFLKLLQALPQRLAATLDSNIEHVLQFHEEIAAQIRIIMNGQNDEAKLVSRRTVFHEILNSSLAPQEKTLVRLKQEAASITGAGIDTTKTTLALATFYILDQPDVYERLYNELVEAIPDPSKIPPLPELEKLPYLSAIIQESLRMSFGVTQRLSRIDPHNPVHYKNWTIPPGTIFGMSSYMMHRDPSIFPRPDVFDPTRWLNNTRSSTGKPLNRYLVTFGRGPRMCLGLNLAYAELHMGLATLFRQLKLKLYETDRSDVDIAADYFVPMPREGSKGVRVTVE